MDSFLLAQLHLTKGVLHVRNEGTLEYLRNRSFLGTNSCLRWSDPCRGRPCWRPPCRSRSRGCSCLPKFPPLPLQPENTVETFSSCFGGGVKSRVNETLNLDLGHRAWGSKIGFWGKG